MWFLIKTTFWLTLVVLLLPLGQPSTTEATRIDTGAAISAASATVSDLKGFCERQPQACTVGQQAVQVVGERAQVGVKMIYDYLTERFGPAAPARETAPTQGTLTERDLQIPWRG